MSRKDLLPDAGPVFDLRQALYRAGRDYKGGLTSLAHDMVLPYEDLQKKLKLDEERRWLNPDELEDIIRLTLDPRLLDALVRPAGVVWYRPEAVDATASALKAVGELLQREGEFVASLHKGADDNRWEPHEVADLEYHGAAVIRAVLGIMAGARASMEQLMEGRANG
ncbi:phage regulatory CII family protein [Pseudomonas citronellolis]|uniref:phage regulatory CII family protein n=1 Tax=Pseudomonas citronellolis TaxID=53408 RepID=UPI002D771642|nr:phage regulatory CII family protein [Pseudomonas citronellolis]WRT82755.1 phage regulatory CII family protein [Pseudomonas citronellolis]